MGDVLKSTHVSVRAEEDLVAVSFGPARALLFYHTAFDIASRLRMACKMAMRHERVPTKEWRKLASTDRDDGRIPRPYPFFRRSRGTTNITSWKISIQGPLVVLVLGNVTVKMHYSDAFQLHTWIRQQARWAKAWAGDRSRTQRMAAFITDAEENYRLGLR